MKDLYFKVLRHKATIPTAIGVASFAAGYATSSLVSRKKPSGKLYLLPELGDEYAGDIGEKYEAQMPVTVSDTPQDHLVTDHAWTEVDVIGKVVDFEEDDDGIVVTSETNESIVNIFKINEEEWDMEAELERRTDESPYVIHVEEFMNDELGFAQSALTYYVGDDILTDEKDVPIYDKTNVVGDLRFGYGSGDPNVVYVRCPKLRAEFEVFRDQGSYAFEVLGVEVEETLGRVDLKHSSSANLRMRSWED